jgi:hypothetical protein
MAPPFTPVTVTDSTTGVDTIGPLQRNLIATWTTPQTTTSGTTTDLCNQPKTFVGNDGYYYAFYADDMDEISYSYTTDGTIWTEVQNIFGSKDTSDAADFVVWYDDASDKVAIARISEGDFTAFYWSIGTPYQGAITWDYFDETKMVLYQSYIEFPSVYIGSNHDSTGTYLWVSVTTEDNSNNYYNEVWRYTYSDISPSWTEILVTPTDFSSHALTVIVGTPTSHDLVLFRGGFTAWSDVVTFYSSINDGTSFTAGSPTSGTYTLEWSGYTVYDDTVYISAVGPTGEGGGSLSLVAYNANTDSVTENNLIPTFPILWSMVFDGGATISVNLYGFTILCAGSDETISITQSQPWYEFNPALMTWMAPTTLWTGSEVAPQYPQIYYKEVPGSPLSAVAEWTTFAPTNTWATILYPSMLIGGVIGILDTTSDMEFISHYNASFYVSDSAIAIESLGHLIHEGDAALALEYLGLLTKRGILDSTTDIESIIVNISTLHKTIQDYAYAVDWAVGGNLVGLFDMAYAEDKISVQKFCTYSPISGAIPLTAMDTDYIALTYRQMIDMTGIPITYRTQHIVGHDAYEHPIIKYTDSILTAFITIFTNVEYEYVEEGFLPNHYASMWIYCVAPQVGDHVVWQSIEWEVRNSIPKVIGNKTVYYQTILRRVLANVPPAAPDPNTLNSGGVASLPTGDP